MQRLRGGWRGALAMVLVASAGGCDGAITSRDAGVDAATLDGGGRTCVAFSPGVEIGQVASPDLVELSGMVASGGMADVFYAHNDSGDGSRLFLLGTDGSHLGVVTLEGASAIDYEDIAIGVGPRGATYVYVGDTGDNAARTGSGSPRDSIVVYRFVEPTFDRTSAPVSLSAAPEAFTLHYPDGPRDCEALAVDPTSGDLLLLSKVDAGPSTLYAARSPLEDGSTLEAIATVRFARGAASATAMDISRSGRALLVRSYSEIHLFTRELDEPWSDAADRDAIILPSVLEPQGEAIAWLAGGRAYVTSSEGAGAAIHRFDATDPDCEPL